MQNLNKNRTLACGALFAVLGTAAGATFVPVQAQKSSNAWRNVAIGAGAVTAYGAIKKKDTVTAVGAGATAYSLYRMKRAKDKERKIKEARRQRWYRQRYGRNWRRYYRPGA